MAETSNIVSFDNEPLMLVDSDDVVIGFEERQLRIAAMVFCTERFQFSYSMIRARCCFSNEVRLNRYGLSTGQTPAVATQDAASP